MKIWGEYSIIAVRTLNLFQLSGLAFEIHDSYLNKQAVEKGDEEEEKTKLQVKYQNVNPTFVDMMLYSYCYAGLLTGIHVLK